MHPIIAKTRENYNKIAEHYAITRRNRLWPELLLFKKYIKDRQRILDWGCGSGRLLELMGDKKVKYIGVDLSAKMLSIIRQEHEDKVKSGEVKLHCVGNRSKRFPDNHFDLIFMIASFHHLPDLKSRMRVLKNACRELKPGGRLLMSVWNLESEWAEAKKKKWKTLGPCDYLVPWKNARGEQLCERYYHAFQQPELDCLLNEAGFKIEKLELQKLKRMTRRGGRNLIAVATK